MSASVYHECPMCGNKGKFHVEPFAIGDRWRIASVDDDGNACCTFNDNKCKNLEDAQQQAEAMNTREAREKLSLEMQDEANSVTDEHGYFFDYGPPDSDYYD